MSLLDIRAALVDAYVTGGFSLPTAYENMEFAAPDDAPWAKVTVITNQPETATLGTNGEDEHTGVLQIDLNYPQGEGDGAILTKADEIRSHFSTGARFTYGQQQVVVRSCGRSTGHATKKYFRIVVSINWYARTAR